jgi:hypothetical protein
MRTDKQERKADSLLGHGAAVAAGIAMMITGLGLGVTMVLLPIGIPLGLLGLVVLIGGLTPGWHA